MLLFLPETGTPRARGVDKADAHDDGRFSWLQNPFAHISICRSPNVVLAVSIFFLWGYHHRSLLPCVVPGRSLCNERQL